MKVNLSIRKEGKNWIFDDENLGIYKELFVEGSSEAIDFAIKKLNLDSDLERFLIASTEKFENCFETELLDYNEQTNWSTYFLPDFGVHRLCPVLLTYFEEPPEKIYFTVE